MTIRYVIATKNRYTSLPLFPTIALFLLLDRFHTPGWLWGVVGTIMASIWIMAIIWMCQCKEVDLTRLLKSENDKNVTIAAKEEQARLKALNETDEVHRSRF